MRQELCPALFLKIGPRAAQKVGPGFRPDRRSSGGAASDKVGQALCLPRPRGGAFICHRISQNTPCSIMASATRLKPAMFAPATRLYPRPYSLAASTLIW